MSALGILMVVLSIPVGGAIGWGIGYFAGWCHEKWQDWREERREARRPKEVVNPPDFHEYEMDGLRRMGRDLFEQNDRSITGEAKEQTGAFRDMVVFRRSLGKEFIKALSQSLTAYYLVPPVHRRVSTDWGGNVTLSVVDPSEYPPVDWSFNGTGYVSTFLDEWETENQAAMIEAVRRAKP